MDKKPEVMAEEAVREEREWKPVVEPKKPKNNIIEVLIYAVTIGIAIGVGIGLLIGRPTVETITLTRDAEIVYVDRDIIVLQPEIIEKYVEVEIIKYVEVLSDLGTAKQDYYKDVINLYEDALDDTFNIIEDYKDDYDHKVEVGEAFTALEVQRYMEIEALMNKVDAEYEVRYDEIKVAHREAVNAAQELEEAQE